MSNGKTIGPSGRIVAAALMLAASGLVSMAKPAYAVYPDHPIRVILPYPAGGASDATLRVVAEKLLPILGQPTVVENRPGASGIPAVDLVAKSKPDGYTLVFSTTATHATNKAMYSDLPYDPVKDFSPVIMLWQSVTMAVATAKLPITSVSELVAYAKAHPKELKYASTGAGSAPHLAVADFSSRTGISMVHVPYSDIGGAFTDLTNGQLSVMFYPYTPLKPLIDSGKVKMLATTGDKRLTLAPQTPTMMEAGVPGFTAGSWNAIFAPAGTPKDICELLFKAYQQVVMSQQVQEIIAADGSSLIIKSPDELAAFMPGEIARIQKIVDAAGAKVR